MKRIATIFLTALLLFSLAACDFLTNLSQETEGEFSANGSEILKNNTNTESEQVDTDNTESDEHKFITNEEKNAWHDKLYSVLLNCDIYDSELDVLGSFAAGLMDFDLDNTPELVLAYHGGSMGNLPLEIYDIKTGEKLSHFNASNNACIYVAQKGNEYFILSETAFRISPMDSASSISIILANKNFDSDFINFTNLFFKETIDNKTSIIYEYQGQPVEKDEYDEKYKQFLEEYKKIEETQIQLFEWSTFGKLEWKDFGYKEGVDPESRQKLAQQMADALISSSQQFIRYEKSNNQYQPNEENKLPETSNNQEPPNKESNLNNIPAEFHDIIDAYVKIANLTRYEGCTTRSSINDKDYPKVSKEHLDIIFNSLMDDWYIYGYFAGYAIKDINGDGIPELFLTDVEYTIYAVFTLVNGEIVSHYFSFDHNRTATKIDASGIFYTYNYGKGECVWYKILCLGQDGNLHGTTFGHYDMTGFGYPDIYNYYYTSDVDLSCSLIEFPQVDGNRLTNEEYNYLVTAYNEAIKKLDVDGLNPNYDIINAIGLEFHQVIIKDLRK